MGHNPIMPEMYYYRGRRASDRDWIESRMTCIPGDKQKGVADEYSRLFLSNPKRARETANRYLNGIALEYRQHG